MFIHFKKTIALAILASTVILAGSATAYHPAKPQKSASADSKTSSNKIAKKVDKKTDKKSPPKTDNVTKTTAKQAAATQDVIDHTPLEILLTKYVNSQGNVGYPQWHANQTDREALKTYLAQIASAPVDGYSSNARLAFYINAYNAIVLDSILSKWPVKSVMTLDGFFDKDKHTIAGQTMTLDDLEHNKVIRVQFQEPRIHFVLVCAAKRCPRLLSTAMTAVNLEKNLESSAREFIPKATKVEGNKVYTSQLFNWFKTDFEKHSGSIPAYLTRYVSADIAQVLNNGTSTIEFTEYDWSINKQ